MSPIGPAVGWRGGHGHAENLAYAGYPDWSPDGTSIVFGTYGIGEFPTGGEGASNLYAVAPDGSGLRQITRYAVGGPRAGWATWTPAGTQLVFTRIDEAGARRIAFVSPDTGLQVFDSMGERHGFRPWCSQRWRPSPDARHRLRLERLRAVGRLPVGCAVHGGRADGRTVSASCGPTGGDAHAILTDVPGRVLDPDWSPDGGTLAFVVVGDDGVGRIWTAAADGSGAKEVVNASTRCPTEARFPAWSPDGNRSRSGASIRTRSRSSSRSPTSSRAT